MGHLVSPNVNFRSMERAHQDTNPALLSPNHAAPHHRPYTRTPRPLPRGPYNHTWHR